MVPSSLFDLRREKHPSEFIKDLRRSHQIEFPFLPCLEDVVWGASLGKNRADYDAGVEDRPGHGLFSNLSDCLIDQGSNSSRAFGLRPALDAVHYFEEFFPASSSCLQPLPISSKRNKGRNRLAVFLDHILFLAVSHPAEYLFPIEDFGRVDRAGLPC